MSSEISEPTTGAFQLPALPPEALQRMNENDEREAARARAELLARVSTGVPKTLRWALGNRAQIEVSLDGTEREKKRVLELVVEPWWERASRLVSRRSVVLMGPAGIGKTAIALRMLRLAFDERWDRGLRDFELLFVAAADLGEARLQHPIGHGEAPLVRDALAADVLVLDDLGRPDVDPPRSAVPYVIDKRFHSGRTTWITTGLTREQIGARYNDGDARRIRERAYVVDVEKQRAAAPDAPSPPAYDAAARRAGDS